jgi:hypothetical protein
MNPNVRGMCSLLSSSRHYKVVVYISSFNQELYKLYLSKHNLFCFVNLFMSFSLSCTLNKLLILIKGPKIPMQGRVSTTRTRKS